MNLRRDLIAFHLSLKLPKRFVTVDHGRIRCHPGGKRLCGEAHQHQRDPPSEPLRRLKEASTLPVNFGGLGLAILFYTEGTQE
jgi:hypothetical protein